MSPSVARDDAPVVSVLMPVRNGMPYLEDAIQSIRAQSFADFEFLIVDDGSTDETPAIVKAAAADDPRIRAHRQPPQGLVGSLNRGIGLAAGRFIARMDADDLALPQRLERQLAFLEAHSDVALVGSAIVLVDTQGHPFETVRYPTDDAAIKERLDRENCFAHPTVTFRKDVVRELGGFRPGFAHAEDYDLWTRIAERYAVANIPEPLLHYRIHATNTTALHLRQQILTCLAIQAAARIRRVTAVDPIAADAQLTPSVLEWLGVGTTEVDPLHYEACLTWARYAAQAGELVEALDLVDEAVSLAARLPHQRRTRTRALRARAQILSHVGPAPRALLARWSFFRAALADAAALAFHEHRRYLSRRLRLRR